jgi:hypothetical protein
MELWGYIMAEKIFVSVGKNGTPEQEDFVHAIEDRLRAEGLIPCTVGRNTWTFGRPLEKVIELMSECTGAVIISLERTYFPDGIERRNHPVDEIKLQDVRLPTPFNQIEAAMAYVYGRPLLVIAEAGLREEGLLERGNDWYVQRIKPERSSLNTEEFNGVLASWKERVVSRELVIRGRLIPLTSKITAGQLLKLFLSMETALLYGIGVFVVVLLSGAFSLGAFSAKLLK